MVVHVNPLLQKGDDSIWENSETSDDEGTDALPSDYSANLRGSGLHRSESRDSLSSISFGPRSASSATAVAIFRRHDLHKNGVLDAGELAAALRSMGVAADQHAVRAVLAHGEADDTVTMEEFVAWHSYQQAPGGLASAADRVKRVRQSVGRGVRSLQTKVLGPQEQAARPVPPESLFVLDTRTNEAARREAEVRQQVYNRFRSEFRQLEDHIQDMNQSNHWSAVWQRVAERSFDKTEEEKCAKELGWSPELMRTAKEAMIQSTGQRGYGTALYRVFLCAVAPSISGLVPGSKPTVQHVRDRAQQFATSPRNEIEEMLSENDHVPVEAAVGAIKKALEKELLYLSKKMKALQRRLEALPPDAPAGVRISGLRGDAAGSNGLYVVSGLRHFFDRSVWTQLGGSNILFYDVSYDNQQVLSGAYDGVWVLGPTLSSGRCTAWLSDPARKSYSPPLTPTAGVCGPEWMVYDTLKAKWKLAPGTHCPQFAVQPDDGSGTVQEYFQAALADQKALLKSANARLTASDFDQTVRATIGARKRPGGKINKNDFTDWRTDFYSEELGSMRHALAKKVTDAFPTAFSNDTGDNRAKVQKLIKDFTNVADASVQERKHAKLRLLSNISRPTVSRAFFAWRLVARRKVSASDLQMGTLFAEPQLPWNIRHPRSDFTSSWEAAQALLLVYIAFVVPWRISYGVTADEYSFLWYFEIGIDAYFTVDVLLNMHTAYYDTSGDLQGLRTVGKDVGKPDYKALYSNYARGWMVIDVSSVLPVTAIARLLAQREINPDTSSKLQLIKGLRLLRLTKLLRLTRGVRIFAKYEETLGPTLKAAVLIGTVMLLFHLLNCIWYSIGTINLDGDNLEGSPSGWVDHKFGVSDTLCGCHNTSTVYYDHVERMCVDTSESVADLMEVCPDSEDVVPSLTRYYLHSMMTALHEPSIDDSYTNTVPELLISAGITGFLGFIWGAVAGAWGTIFSANQMASQRFRLKLAEIKEFCRVKGLDYGVKAKLLAHYEHLYPEHVIVDDHHVLDDLPPIMRSELVRRLYGKIISSVPLFVGLDPIVLTELCMALTPEPALKRQVLTVEGSRGTGLHCVSAGACRVSRIERGREDDIRIKMWIEDVYEAKGRPLTLFSANMRMHLEQLLRRLHFMTRNNKKTSSEAPVLWYKDVFNDLEVDELVAESGVKLTTMLVALQKQNAVTWTGVLQSPPTSNGPAIKVIDSPIELEGDASLSMLCAALRDGVVLGEMLNLLLPDDKRLEISRPTFVADLGAVVTESVALTEDVMTAGLNMTAKMVDSSQQATFQATGKMVSAVPDSVGGKALGSAFNAVGEIATSATAGVMSAAESSIKTTRLVTDLADEATVIPNLEKIVAALVDPDFPFRLPPESCMRVDDLRLYDSGAFYVQRARRNRVLKCLLDLAWRVSTMDDYTGPQLDAVTMGILGPGEFFGELSLLPHSGQTWRHTRTHTAVTNSMLYFLSKEAVDGLARRFPDLKQLLGDYAEDYQRLHGRTADAQAPLPQGGAALGKVSAGVDLAQEIQVDPVAHLQEALEQLDAKVCESDKKMDDLSCKVVAIDEKLDSFMGKVLGALGAE